MHLIKVELLELIVLKVQFIEIWQFGCRQVIHFGYLVEAKIQLLKTRKLQVFEGQFGKEIVADCQMSQVGILHDFYVLQRRNGVPIESDNLQQFELLLCRELLKGIGVEVQLSEFGHLSLVHSSEIADP